MNDIDIKIHEALRNEDEQLWQHYSEEPSLHEMVIETFRGRHRWLVVMVFFSIAILVGLLACSGYKFYYSQTNRDLITWATAFLSIFVWIAMLKIWYWIELGKNSVTREVKRLELQIAKLTQHLESKQSP
jgi:hypothetical protein